MELTVLGTAGTWPPAGGATCGFLVSHEGTNIWLDAGTGTFARLQEHIGIDDVAAIVVSHGHTDHFIDVIPAFYARHYGHMGTPGLPFYSPEGFVDSVSLLVSEDGKDVLREAYSFRTVGRGDAFEVGPFSISVFEMTHIGVNAVGYRIEAGGAVLAYTGDTGPSEEVIELARDADVLHGGSHVPGGVREDVLPPERRAGGRARGAGRREAPGAHPHPAHAGPGGLPRGGPERVRRSRRDRLRGLHAGDRLVTRPDGRSPDQLRPVSWELGFQEWAAGSVLFSMGKTRVLVAASVSDDAPRWLKGTGNGWVTGEYSMLPASTNERTNREVNRGRPGGRTQEIQRLIGRSLRSVTDLSRLGERTITIDCDVLQADAGTRTASITGGYIALAMALRDLAAAGQIPDDLLTDSVAAVSVGIVEGEARLDLCYEEDAGADVDFNVVMTGSGEFVEVQGTAEGTPFSRAQLDGLLDLAAAGITDLTKIQQQALEG